MHPRSSKNPVTHPQHQDSPSPSKRLKTSASVSSSSAAMLAGTPASSSRSSSSAAAASGSSARPGSAPGASSAASPPTTRPSLRFGSNLGFMQHAKAKGFSSPSTLSSAALASRSASASGLSSTTNSNSTNNNGSSTFGSKYNAPKIVIRGLVSKPVLPADFRDSTWATLERAITCILTRQPLPPGQGHGLEDLYRSCEALCTHKHGEWVYAQVTRVLGEHATRVHTGLISDSGAGTAHVGKSGVDEASEYLTRLVSAWAQYTEALRLVRAVLLYLDRTYALPKGQTPLWEVGVDAFLHHVLSAPADASPAVPANKTVQNAAVDATITLVRAFRQLAPSGPATAEGMDVDVDPTATGHLALIRAVADLLIATNQYTKVLEPALLHTTTQDLTQSSIATLHQLAATYPSSPLDLATAYLHHTHVTQHVNALLASHLPPVTTEPLTSAVLDALVTTHRFQALLPGVPYWLAKGRTAELAAVARLLEQVGCFLPDFTNAVYAWANDMAKVVIQGRAGQIEMAREAVEVSRARAERCGLVAPGSGARAAAQAAALAGASASGGGPVITVSSAENIRIIEELMTIKVHLEWIAGEIGAGMPKDKAAASADPAAVSKRDVTGLVRRTVDQALADAMNAVAKEAHPAEKLAKYVDGFMKSKRTAATEPVAGGGKSTVDLVVEHVMQVFQYLKDKDTFLKFHKKDLARRLLQGTVTSDDAEKELVKQLSKERGHEVSEPLNKMFHDVSQSKSLRTEFRASSIFKSARPTVDLDVTVGQESVWPSDLSTFASFAPPTKPHSASAPPPVLGPNVHLPPDLAHAMDTFNKWYASAQKGRTLRWQLELGTVLVHAHYGKDFVCTMPMALVLLAFNEFPPEQALGFGELASITGLDKKVLRITLQSMSCTPKVKVLLKSPPPGKTGGDVRDDDKFVAVTKLDHKAVRIKLPSVVPKEVEEMDAAKTRGQVETDRTGALDAAVVRVMKARKRLMHAELFAEVVRQCNFGVDAAMFKKRVEDLMEREFLAREDKEKNVYIYLP
ncbi:hypothetical protein BCR44DRAFT_67845 [Catenaria anguillulae PL171]|uniref:Cullin family profile domain-containing protein n=1 Tax=Catenaria anguillulae PL171 TaxID=765915 RepID=A0A1Y2HW12_9FUNG|nr:hypothetical protein BCR44DRAFT_67845 [Catenaria anguillulae PL171]